MEAYINATCFWKQVGMAYRQPIFQASSLALISLGFAPTRALRHCEEERRSKPGREYNG